LGAIGLGQFAKVLEKRPILVQTLEERFFLCERYQLQIPRIRIRSFIHTLKFGKIVTTANGKYLKIVMGREIETIAEEHILSNSPPRLSGGKLIHSVCTKQRWLRWLAVAKSR
jgi:hypothetical protein